MLHKMNTHYTSSVRFFLIFFLLQSSVIKSVITDIHLQDIHLHLLSVAKNNPFTSQVFYVTVCIYFSLSFTLFYLWYFLALKFGTKQDLCHFNTEFSSAASHRTFQNSNLFPAFYYHMSLPSESGPFIAL